MPEMLDSVAVLISAIFSFTFFEAAMRFFRERAVCRITIGRKIANMATSSHRIVSMSMSEPLSVKKAIKRSSGPWWASSVISNKSFVMRDISWPVLVPSKKAKDCRSIWANMSRLISASTRAPKRWPK